MANGPGGWNDLDAQPLAGEARNNSTDSVITPNLVSEDNTVMDPIIKLNPVTYKLALVCHILVYFKVSNHKP